MVDVGYLGCGICIERVMASVLKYIYKKSGENIMYDEMLLGRWNGRDCRQICKENG